MQTYSHSGAVPAGGALTTVLAGAVTAVIGGIIYAYAFYWIPLIYVNFLVTLGFAGAIGYVIAATAKRGKIRNNLFVRVMAILITLSGLYVYWGVYLWAIAGIDKIGILAFWPPVLYAFGQHLFEKGSWGIFAGDPLTGWILVGVWVIEAGTVLWVAVSAALGEARRPFCESCNEWTEIESDVARLAATGQEPAWQQVFAGDLPSLAAFPPASPGAHQFVRLDAARCPRCEHSRFLTVSTVEITIDKKGKASEKQQYLATNAILTPAQFAVVEACSQLCRQGPVEPPTGGANEPPEPSDPAPADA